MGKSSSSSKKLKRSSKEDPSKLRSVKKKKTKRSKSKKIRRIKDSSSDESESDSSFYSSSSEDDYMREKKRRSKLSKRKKRSRKRYSSSSESDDDDIRLLKKKKRSKRKNERVVTKKKKKKRSRRDSSSSSTSSDEGSESDGMRITREKGGVKDASEEPDEYWQVEDDVMTEKKNSKRLKSIVVVTYNYDDGDERKEGMVDDESDENVIVDDQRDGEATTLSSPAHDNRRIGYDDFEEFTNSETSKASYPDNSLKGDDLEAILKKRALENLKRFRGESQRNGTVSKEVSSVSEGETRQTESEKFEESQERLLVEQKLCVSEGDRDLEASQVENVKESGTGLADLPSQQSGDTVKVKAGPGISSCTTTKRKLIRPVLGQESVNLASRKEAAARQDTELESINGKSCPESSLALATKNVGESIEPTKDSSTSPPHADTESLDENKGESQSEQRTNDESQYEKKTMTVMRGGEMVQVSYKVYIPKKTSSLGRRQLRR